MTTSDATAAGEKRRQSLLALMEAHGLAPRDVADLCHVSKSATVHRWVNGTRFPSKAALALLELQIEKRSA